MIKLIYAEDLKLAQKELEKSLTGIDSLNIISFQEPFDKNVLKNEIMTAPFLTDKKAVIIQGLLSAKDQDTSDNLLSILKDYPSHCEIIFIETEKPDTRKKLYKKIAEKGKIVQLANPAPNEIPRWIVEFVKEHGGEITPSAVQKLSSVTTNDLLRLENELVKLLNYSKKITEENVNKLVKSDFNESIFALTDAISTKNRRKSLNLVESFFDEGENESYILSMLARQIRNLMIVKELLPKGEVEIAKITGLHPYVVKKSLSHAKSFSGDELFFIHQTLLEIDEGIKTGINDPKIALTLLISKITK